MAEHEPVKEDTGCELENLRGQQFIQVDEINGLLWMQEKGGGGEGVWFSFSVLHRVWHGLATNRFISQS